MRISLSDWYVKNGGILYYDASGWKRRPFTIFYLDDHKLYRDEVIKQCIKSHFPNAAVKAFSHAYDAYWYLESCLQRKEIPDLFITDIHHPGIHGADLVEMIRKAEAKFPNETQLPIIVLSMSDSNFRGFQRPGEEIFCRIPKSASAEKISECITVALRGVVCK